MKRALITTVVLAVCIGVASTKGAQLPPPPAADPFHRPLDQILDVNVRDGLCALSRAAVVSRCARPLCRVAQRSDGNLRRAGRRRQRWPSGSTPTTPSCSRRSSIAIRSAARAALIRRRASGRFQAPSIRPKHRVAGRSVTLDEIDETVLPEFNEPRLTLALGRGAVGSGRLRSEAYSASRLTEELDSIESEFVTRHRLFKMDRTTGVVSPTAILSWHEAEFVAVYGSKAGDRFASRSPIERALVAFISPHAAAREGVSRREQVQGCLPGVRPAAQRPDRRPRGVAKEEGRRREGTKPLG